MSADRRYCGKAWKKEFDNGGHVINVALNVNELKAAGLKPDQYGNIFLIIGERKSPDEKSKATHWVAVDEYKYKR